MLSTHVHAPNNLRYVNLMLLPRPQEPGSSLSGKNYCANISDALHLIKWIFFICKILSRYCFEIKKKVFIERRSRAEKCLHLWWILWAWESSLSFLEIFPQARRAELRWMKWNKRN